MDNAVFNMRLKQVVLFALIIILALLLVKELIVFLPGVLGAITLYIISRGYFFDFVHRKKWNKNLVAILFIIQIKINRIATKFLFHFFLCTKSKK